MNKKYLISIEVYAQDKDEAFNQIDKIVNNAILEEGTIQNTLQLVKVLQNTAKRIF